jgi:hypothetical protein
MPRLRRILGDKSVARRVAELLVGQPVLQSYPLTINRERSRSEMVAAGNYDYVHHDITEKNFPVAKGETEVKAVLVRLDRVTSEEEALAEMERRGLRPATMDELNAFGEQHPKRKRGYSIVALGSVLGRRRGDRRVGYLWNAIPWEEYECEEHKRVLDLHWLDHRWGEDYRFLAVRK